MVSVAGMLPLRGRPLALNGGGCWGAAVYGNGGGRLRAGDYVGRRLAATVIGDSGIGGFTAPHPVKVALSYGFAPFGFTAPRPVLRRTAAVWF